MIWSLKKPDLKWNGSARQSPGRRSVNGRLSPWRRSVSGRPSPLRRTSTVKSSLNSQPPKAKVAALPLTRMTKVRSPQKQSKSLSYSPLYHKKKSQQFLRESLTPKTCMYKLHRKVTLTNEDEDEVSFIDGKLRTKKRTGTTKDYPQPSTWSRAFIQYVSILSEFKKFNGLTRPLLTFHELIMDLAQTYAWERVVVLALTFHKERLVLGIHDKAW
jgi:hypothetical protein